MNGASGGVSVVNLGRRDTNDIVWNDVFVSEGGKKTIVFRCSSPEKRAFVVQVDGGEPMPVAVEGTGGAFKDVELTVVLERGIHSIRLSNPRSAMPDIDLMRIPRATRAE